MVEPVRSFLIRKFEEIERRMLLVLDQLNEDQLHWRPNDASNSAANLIVHICGNIDERILGGIRRQPVSRDRDREFMPVSLTKPELAELLRGKFAELIETVNAMDDEAWGEKQIVRGKQRTYADVLLQCAAHFSEHLGQVLYIGKMCVNDRYVTTSIPRRERADEV